MTGWILKKCPGPTSPITYFLISYCLWPHGSANCAHAAKGEWVMTHRESQQAWLVREKQGKYRREVAEILDKIPKGAPQVCLTREIPPSQGTLYLNQVGCTQSTGGQQEAKYHIQQSSQGLAKFIS